MGYLRSIGLAAVMLGAAATDARASCSVSATGVAFGGYNVFATSPLDSTGAVTLLCTKNEKNVRVTLGNGWSSSFDRLLYSGADRLNYNLYLDATHAVVWGDGSNGTGRFDVTRPPRDQPVHLVVYGRIPAGQDVRVGYYYDFIVVTVLY